MANPKKLLILGGSMTGAWQRIDDTFYTDLGLTPKIISWNAQAWRHQKNHPPYTLKDGRLSFNAPVNCTEHFDQGRKFTPFGATSPIDLDDVCGIVFTQPTTTRNFLSRLHSDHFYIHTDSDPEGLKPKGKDTYTPLSRAAFLAWWCSHQFYADRFLQEMLANHPGIPIFVTPSILPRPDQSMFSKAFRFFTFRMDRILLEILTEKYGVNSCTQPKDTFDTAGYFTHPRYAEPSPDIHHYTPAYVESICKTPAFQTFLATL